MSTDAGTHAPQEDQARPPGWSGRILPANVGWSPLDDEEGHSAPPAEPPAPPAMRPLRAIARSIYSPGFYASLAGRRVRSGVGYFALLAFALTVINSILALGSFFSLTPGNLSSVIADVAGYYPDELIVTIENGRVATNVQEPYFIRTIVSNSSSQYDQRKNLLVIDTANDFTTARFRSYSTAAWLGKDALYVRDDEGVRVFDLSSVDGVRIERGDVDSLVAAVAPWLRFALPGILMAAFVGTYLLYMFRLVHVALIALLVCFVARRLGYRWGYGHSYAAGLYAITLGLLLELALGVLHPWLHLTGFPFMVTLSTLLVVAANLLLAQRQLHGGASLDVAS
jgi:hypothetical protein